ncbi:MAG: glycosyl hydrolase family 18 protein [Bacteroidia bacterium]|jgi:spore germination protein YaaH|nr:glycosyl hydrolase family 18 protein [Bacteroidia bacterium]
MRYFLLSLFCIALTHTYAQQISEMQQQSQQYAALGAHNDFYWDSLRVAGGGTNSVAVFAPAQTTQSCTLTRRVFGWHPYWVGSVYNNYQWNLLSDLCYFDYAVSPTTGNNTNASFQWNTSAAVTAAINNNVDVHICATLFGSHSTFLNSTTAKQTFITNIISLLQARGGKGVNIDFEGMASSDRNAFTAFIAQLKTQLTTAIPGSEVSMALYAVDWGNVFDIAALTPNVDAFIIMGYDYYWSGSTTAGPNDPLYNFQTSYNYTLSRSITFYLRQGMPSNKLLLGLPYYGREWETVSSAVPSATTGNFTASRTYEVVRTNANNYYNTQLWEANSFTPYFTYQLAGNWRQCFINDGNSMRSRFDMVNQRNLGGIGIWALGYDNGYMDYWNAIEDRLSSCAVVPCSDTIWDMGGPTRNYYDGESYTYTIAPAGAYRVQLVFSSFDVETNFDSLFLYDGPTAASPLIGSYTGTNSPGTIISSGSTLTLRLKSDNATTRPGYTAVWTCLADTIVPQTSIAVPPGWITQNFTATFTDADAQSGIDKAFYQVSDYNGSEWRANAQRGFFNDDFVTLHPDWTVYTGTWNVNTQGQLVQSDEGLANTNIYASLTQNLSNRYCYHWQGKITGTGNNRRAGFHFASDSGALANRGNSYFVWFRLDQGTLEFYKVVNDVFSLQQTVALPLTNNVWYDFKVMYDRILGRIEVYVNNEFAGSWTDSQPYQNGRYISFRSGNSNWAIDDFRVYRSRVASAGTVVNVGNCALCDMRWQSANPSAEAGRIRSLNNDVAKNISAIATESVLVDWTPPQAVNINDGAAADIDTTFLLTQLEANWTAAVDPHSGVAFYEYAFGTTPGGTDVVNWTALNANYVLHAPLTLTPGQWYYATVRSTNGAGLTALADTSNGQLAEISTAVWWANQQAGVVAYPNPFGEELQLKLTLAAAAPVMVCIKDATGRVVMQQPVQEMPAGTALLTLNTAALAPGMYITEINCGGKLLQIPLIRR